jgi:hypothetical protein
MRGLLVLAMTLMVVLASTLACSPSYAPCYRGEYQGCSCANGAHGYQACNVTEDGFQACVCDGTTPGVDGGRDASVVEASVADASEAGVSGGYLQPCGPGGTCKEAAAVCFSFTSKGQLCTKKCTMASDCPAPSAGCSTMNGVCKAP